MTKHYVQENLEVHIDEMDIGDTLTTRPRVVSATDIELFAAYTGDPGPGFLSSKWAQEKGFKDRVAPGLLTFSLAVGLLWQSGFISHVIAFLGTDKVRFITPVYPGDTIRVQVEVLGKRPTKSPDRMICNYSWQVINQDNDVLAEGENTCLFQLSGGA